MAIVTVLSPSLGRATGERVALSYFGTVPGPASVAPHHPKYRNDFGSRRHSLPQEASYSFNYSLFSLSSVADTTSEGLELLR